MSGRLDEPRKPARVFQPPVEIRHNRPWPNHNLTSEGWFYLAGRSLDSSLAYEHNGWYTSTEAGDEEPRVVVPCYGILTHGFWQARLISKEPGKRWLSPHGPRGDAIAIVYPRKSIRNDTAMVVEGPMCALAAAGLGYFGLALLGATPPKVAVELAIRVCKNRPAVLIADSDSPKTMAELVPRFAEAGVPTRLLIPTVAKDLAAMTPEEREAFLHG